MEQVSRPFQIVFVLVLGFAGLWFVALRPKTDTAGGGAPAPTPAVQTPAPQSDAAAPPKKSPIPGGLGRAVDKANATKAQGDASAAASDAPAQNTTPTPVQTSPPKPVVQTAPPAPKVAAAGTGLVRTGTVAIGLVNTGIDKAIGAKANSVTVKHVAPHRSAQAVRDSRPGFATPAKVRAALAKRHAVVLLFYSARSSDDRAVRRELAAVNTRGGRVQAWGVSVRGLSRFKNVLQGAQVLQSPSVLVLSHHKPYVFSGYTDHAEIDQAAAVALRPRS
jgi:hypothetical protein